MINRRRCCAHCPGNPVSSSRREDHVCPVPTYISGNLKVSFLRGSSLDPGEEERSKRLRRRSNPREKSPDEDRGEMSRNSIAKKFHAENLQHQPLPDRVEDAIFANSSAGKKSLGCPCVRNAIERCRAIVPESLKKSKKVGERSFGPVLGCKKPESDMDLAICWETPLNPVYEPRKTTHVDGSNGGAAPAVFTLVHREKSPSCGCFKHLLENELFDEKQDDYCACHHLADMDRKKVSAKENVKRNPSIELCKDLDSIHISKHVCGKVSSAKPNFAREVRRSKYSRQFRHCVACDEKNEEKRLNERSRSANCFLTRYNDEKIERRNGLPGKRALVPRPRTPFARRSFCIDTLTPPFSVVTGSRDADYPEHWRLASIYQQSYRNPKKQRGTILTYL